MPSFGANLKREREKRSITLEQISGSTKIGTRLLQAIESDHFDQLPGGIFNKGFVRAYARCVGLDEEQTVADYLEASGEKTPPPAEVAVVVEHETRVEDDAPSSTFRFPWGLMAAVLLLIALVLAVWSQRRHEETIEREGATPVVNEPVHAITPASATTSSITPASSTSPPVVSTAEPPKVSPQSSVPGSVPKVAAPALHAAALESAATATRGEFVVLVQAREDSWITATEGDRVLFSGTMVQGDQRAFRGHSQLVVKAGNSGAVDFSFNGKKLDKQGDYGQVKTLTFAASGIVPNAVPATPIAQ